MKASSDTPARASSIAMHVAVVALAAYHALPTLVAAWGNDLYSRGAAPGFAVWLLLLGWVSLRKSVTHPPSTWWMLMALGFCLAGAMGGLRVIQHLALAASVAAFLGGFFPGLLGLISSFAWLPASGWVLSQLKIGGFSGWERPLAAFVLCAPLLVSLWDPRLPESRTKS